MKKHLLIRIGAVCIVMFFLTAAGVTKTFAQDHKVELTPFGGYLLGGSIKFYEGKFKVNNNACYGGMLAVKMHGGNFVELSYTRMDTRGDWRPYSGYIIDYPEKSVDLAVNYLMIGTVNELPLDNEALRPYGTVSLGTTWFHPKENVGNDYWMFALAGGVGLKYFFSERIGIRIQARLLLPLVYNGTYFYFGAGTGGVSSGVGVSGTAPIVQGDFTGGLIIALGQ